MAELALRTTINFHTTSCYACAVQFAFPSELYESLLRTKAAFYCPNGHPQVYTGKSKDDMLREAEAIRTNLQKRLEWAEQSTRQAQFDAARQREAAKTLRRRLRAGVCPCCKRTFKELSRHMDTKHPEYGKDAANPDG